MNSIIFHIFSLSKIFPLFLKVLRRISFFEIHLKYIQLNKKKTTRIVNLIYY